MNNIVFREDGTILLRYARMSYPHLFEPYGKEADKEKKFSGKFLLPKATHLAEARALHAKIVGVSMESFKQKLAPSQFCLKDGASMRDDYKDYFVVSANEKMRPATYGPQKQVIATEAEAVKNDWLYPGCEVHVLVRLWAQSNSFGKRVNANLIGVQMARHNEKWTSVNRPDLDEVFGVEEGFGDANTATADAFGLDSDDGLS